MIPKIETQSNKHREEYQNSRLRDTLKYVASNSKYYKKLFDKHRIRVSSINTVKSLSVIPPTTKDDIQKFNWDFLCVEKNKIVDYCSTSGTTGKPITIALTKNDLDRLAYNEAISFACADGNKDDLYQLMLTLDRQFMAGIAYYLGIQKLGARSVRIGPGAKYLQFETIENLRPSVIVAVPSFLINLTEYFKQHNLQTDCSSVKKIVCIGENIRTPDFDLNPLGQKLSETWKAKFYSTYASTEMQTAFTECLAGKGGHIHPELIVAELLDENNQPVIENEFGELTITTLGIEGMPLVRYKTGDIVKFHHEPCICGRTTPRISPIIGRKQHLIKLKGTTIYPSGIYDILQSSNNVNDFVIEMNTTDLATDEIKLHLVVEKDTQSSVCEELTNMFRSKLKVTPQFSFCDKEKLEEMQFKDGRRKASRFIDNRNQLL